MPLPLLDYPEFRHLTAGIINFFLSSVLLTFTFATVIPLMTSMRSNTSYRKYIFKLSFLNEYCTKIYNYFNSRLCIKEKTIKKIFFGQFSYHLIKKK